MTTGRGDKTSPNGAAPPRVAAIVPVYRAGFLADALRSIMSQTRVPDEVIVVDDGSPDRAEVARAIEPFGDRITVIRQPNLGAAAARNRGLRATTAEFVALLDADDEWYPTFLAELVEMLTRHPELDLVYSDGLITGKTGLAGQRFMQSCPSIGEVTFESLLEQRCTVLLSGVVMRRQAAVDAGGFDLEIRRGQDFDLWLRMAFRGARMSYLQRPLVVRRVHDQNLSGTAVDEQERPLRVIEKLVATLPLSDTQQRLARRRIRHLNGTLAREHGKEFLRRGEFRAARREFARAQDDSFSWKIYAALLGLQIAPHLVRRLYLIRAAALVSSPLSPLRHLP